MYLFFITLIGFYIRFININKPEGLWNDEYISWMISATPFNEGFWNEILKQCHMPLYYLYLKPFSHYSDIVLRLTSVIPSVLAIPVMYLIGKEYSNKCGYFCALITAFLPFLVYYSQEVRFYSLVFLISALLLLYAIKIIKNNKTKDKIIYSICIILLILTHHLGLIYATLLTFYIFYKKRKLSIKIILSLIAGFVICLSIGQNIIAQLPSAQWWGVFSYTNILFLFSDFFSPILSNNINAPARFFYTQDIVKNALLLIPTLIAVLGIFKSSVKAKGFAAIALLNIICIGILAHYKLILFITKYSIEILPILILLIVLELHKEKMMDYLLIIFVLIEILTFFTQYNPTYIYRSEGHKIVGDIINSSKPQKVLYTYYAPDRFERYLNDKFESYYISKINRNEFRDNPISAIDNVKTGEKVSFVFLDSVSFVPENITDKSILNNIPEMFVTFSEIKNKLIKEVNDNYKDYNVIKQGDWTVITAVKK